MTGTVRATFDEALANLVSRRGLTLMLVSLWWMGVTATFVAESRATASVIAAETDLVGAGYRTLYVEPNDNLRSALSADDCASLDAIGGVDAVVWLLAAEQANLWAPSGPPISMRFVGGDVVRFLTLVAPAAMAGWRGEQVFIDPASTIVPRGTARPIELLVDETTSVIDARSVALTSLGAGLAGNMIAVTAESGPVEACAVLVDDAFRARARESVAAAMPVGRGYVARWALPSADRFDAPPVDFAERGSRWMWLATAGVLALTSAMYLRIRRAEYTFYAACGLSPRRLTALVMAELTLIGGVASLAAATSIGIISRKVGDSAAVGVGVGASARCALVAWALTAGVSAHRAISSRDALVRQLKDR